MKKLNEGRFIYAKLWTCDNRFFVSIFPCCTWKYPPFPYCPAIFHPNTLKMIYFSTNLLLLLWSPFHYCLLKEALYFRRKGDVPLPCHYTPSFHCAIKNERGKAIAWRSKPWKKPLKYVFEITLDKIHKKMLRSSLFNYICLVCLFFVLYNINSFNIKTYNISTRNNSTWNNSTRSMKARENRRSFYGLLPRTACHIKIVRICNEQNLPSFNWYGNSFKSFNRSLCGAINLFH